MKKGTFEGLEGEEGSTRPDPSGSADPTTMTNANGYKREGVQKVRAGRFETSKFINLNGGDGQNENI